MATPKYYRVIDTQGKIRWYRSKMKAREENRFSTIARMRGKHSVPDAFYVPDVKSGTEKKLSHSEFTRYATRRWKQREAEMKKEKKSSKKGGVRGPHTVTHKGKTYGVYVSQTRSDKGSRYTVLVKMPSKPGDSRPYYVEDWDHYKDEKVAIKEADRLRKQIKKEGLPPQLEF